MGQAGLAFLEENHDVALLARRYASALDAVVDAVDESLTTR